MGRGPVAGGSRRKASEGLAIHCETAKGPQHGTMCLREMARSAAPSQGLLRRSIAMIISNTGIRVNIIMNRGCACPRRGGTHPGQTTHPPKTKKNFLWEGLQF